MDYETINQAMELVKARKAEQASKWQDEIGPPAKEITLKIDEEEGEFSSITYGVWYFERPTNPDFQGINESFVMVVEKTKSGYFQDRARYFPQTLVKAMFGVMLPSCVA